MNLDNLQIRICLVCHNVHKSREGCPECKSVPRLNYHISVFIEKDRVDAQLEFRATTPIRRMMQEPNVFGRYES